MAGWVSKEEMLKVDEVHNHYMEILQTTDAPWVHLAAGDLFGTERGIGDRPGRVREESECVRAATMTPCEWRWKGM